MNNKPCRKCSVWLKNKILISLKRKINLPSLQIILFHILFCQLTSTTGTPTTFCIRKRVNTLYCWFRIWLHKKTQTLTNNDQVPFFHLSALYENKSLNIEKNSKHLGKGKYGSFWMIATSLIKDFLRFKDLLKIDCLVFNATICPPLSLTTPLGCPVVPEV